MPVRAAVRIASGERIRIVISPAMLEHARVGDAPAHSGEVSPKIEFMREQFCVFFERAEIIEYPMVAPGVGRRPALVASGKRPMRAA
jgi:hypothetical protein